MADECFTVVVVDDAAEVRGVVATELRLSGRFLVVAEGETGRDAVELAAEHRPDLVLLDASMPDVDGLEALPALLAASPRTRVVMLSGFDDASLGQAAMARGAAAFVEKAQPIRDLPGRLLEVLGAEGAQVAAAPGERDAANEAVLAEHLERFRTVFDQAAIGMATLTLAGRLVRANEALANITGQPASALVGRHYAELADGHSAPVVLAGLGQAVAVDEGVRVEHRMMRGDERRWVDATLAAVRDTGGRPLYLFAQVEDVTGARQAAEQLRASDERFRLLVEAVQDYAIFMLDPNGHITTWNQGAERMKGYRAEEIIGRHFSVFYPEPVRAAGHPERELVLAVRDGRYEEEGWRIRKDGSRFWANVVITALFADDGSLVGFAKVTRDVTERRRAHDEREQAAAELTAANEALRSAAQKTSEFVAVTAHELQSPITAIGGAADLLVEHWQGLDEGEREETLGHIAMGTARIRRLLSDLLTASRLEAGSVPLTLESVAVADAVADAVAEVSAVVSDVTVSVDGSLRVLADRSRLIQILTNLLTNAGKYGAAPVTVSASACPAGVEVRVADAGPGVPEELVPRLFDKFSRSGRGRGTGLGLFVVRELARAQGGDAWYEDGSVFAVRLRSVDD